MTIPPHGRPVAEVLAALDGLRAHDAPVHGGRVLAYVYDSGRPDVDEAARAALAAFGEVNALDPTVYPSVARFEDDLVGWALGLLGGGPEACGTVTSGGTESCILAVLAAREAWRAGGSHTTRPAVVVPITAHAAFVKAAHLLDVELRVVPVDPYTKRVRADDVVAALDDLGDRAALVVVSAPSYAHGVVDPVTEVAAVAAERGVPVHVDACIGGFVLPYLRAAGRAVPAFDLSVPGVRSISADLHKYGYAPKGVSLLLFADSAYRLGTYFTHSVWPGYPVVNTTLQGTKSAGPMAAAWTVVNVLGDSGLGALARDAAAAADAVVEAVAGIPGLKVAAVPDSSLVALTSDPDATESVDPFALADRMRPRGWLLQPQPACGDLPRTVHLTMQASSLAAAPQLTADLAAAADECRGRPAPAPDPALIAAAQQIDVDTLDEATVAGLVALAGLGTGGQPSLPEESGPVLALLESLPPSLRNRLLAGFFSLVFAADRGPRAID